MLRLVFLITPASVMSGSPSEKCETSDGEVGERDRDEDVVEAVLAAAGENDQRAIEVGPAGLWLIRVATNAAEESENEELAAMPSSTTAAADGTASNPPEGGSTGPSTEGVAAQSTAGSTTSMEGETAPGPPEELQARPTPEDAFEVNLPLRVSSGKNEP